MERRKIAVQAKKNLSWDSLDTWLPMDYFSIQEKCSRLNIIMVLLLLFMEAGTEHPSNKKVIMLFLFHSKMESRPVIMKFLLTDLRVQIISWDQRRQNIVL